MICFDRIHVASSLLILVDSTRGFVEVSGWFLVQQNCTRVVYGVVGSEYNKDWVSVVSWVAGLTSIDTERGKENGLSPAIAGTTQVCLLNES